jgi:23S rRNA pseudouridine1911/1915/1917 synthase
VAGLSRRPARVLLDIGGVFVDGRRVKVAGRPMHAGEEVVAVMGGALARATKKTGPRRARRRRAPAAAVHGRVRRR